MKNFKDKNHRIAFTEAIDKHDKNDYAFMAAVYLLTVDKEYRRVINEFEQELIGATVL